MPEQWEMTVDGVVTRLTENQERVPVPHGAYLMTELDVNNYELSREGGPTFRLTRHEIAHYMGTAALKAVAGQWP